MDSLAYFIYLILILTKIGFAVAYGRQFSLWGSPAFLTSH